MDGRMVAAKLVELVEAMKAAKPNDRSEKDRYAAIAITDAEKLLAFYSYYVAEVSH